MLNTKRKHVRQPNKGDDYNSHDLINEGIYDSPNTKIIANKNAKILVQSNRGILPNTFMGNKNK